MRLHTAMMIAGVVAVGWLALAPSTAAPQAQVPDHLDEREELLAYGMGFYLGEEIRLGIEADGLEVDEHDIVRGFMDGLHGSRAIVSRDELDEVLYVVHEEMQRRAVEQWLEEDPNFKKLHDDNLAAAKAFLAEYASKPGVEMLPGGVYHEVLEAGDGPTPSFDDLVRVNYTIKLLGDRELASGEDEVIEVNDVTPGAAMVLQAMKVGDHWRVVIPPDLAYGPGGDPPVIGPNEVLIGEVELLAIE